jgi:hypothetical protein
MSNSSTGAICVAANRSQAMTVSSLIPLIRWIAAREFRSGEHGKTLDDGFLVVSFAVKDRPPGFGNDLSTGSALPTLTAFARQAKLANIASVHAPVIGTRLIPAERTGRH